MTCPEQLRNVRMEHFSNQHAATRRRKRVAPFSSTNSVNGAGQISELQNQELRTIR